MLICFMQLDVGICNYCQWAMLVCGFAIVGMPLGGCDHCDTIGYIGRSLGVVQQGLLYFLQGVTPWVFPLLL